MREREGERGRERERERERVCCEVGAVGGWWELMEPGECVSAVSARVGVL